MTGRFGSVCSTNGRFNPWVVRREFVSGMKGFAVIVSTILTGRRSSVRWQDACLMLTVSALSTPSFAGNGCYYDGVSQTSIEHIIEQLSDRYQIAALVTQPTAANEPDELLLRQPLGDCSLQQFLQLATAAEGSRWRYLQSAAGVVFRIAEPGVAANEMVVVETIAELQPELPEELLVTGLQFATAPAIADRYASTTLEESAYLPTGELGGQNRLTAALASRAAVTFSQEAGVDRNISVRGLGSEFTRVSVNGMPMLATGTSIDARGSVNNSRSFDFNVLPEGLFNQVSIVKSANARTAAGAIGGSVNMNSPRPFDDRSMIAGSRQQWLTLQQETNVSNGADGGALSLGLQGLNDAGDFGWTLALSYRQRSTLEKGYSTVRWQVADWGEQDQLTDEQQQQLADDVFYPRHNRYDILQRQLTTAGFSAVLQWRDRPWGNLDLTLVGSHHKQDMHEYHITSAGIRTQQLSDVTVNDFELGAEGMIYGSFSGVDIRSEHNHEEDSTDLGQLKLNWSKSLDERWSLASALGYQASVFHSPLHNNISMLAEDQDFSFDLRQNRRISINRYGFDIADPAEWQLWRITMYEDRVVNRYKVAESELEFRQSPTLTHWLGAKYQAFSNERQQASYSWDSDDGDAMGYTGLTPGYFSRGLGISGALPTRWVVGQQGLIDALGLNPSLLEKDPTQQRQLRENSWAGWWQSSFELWQWPWPVRGDIGVRYAATRQQVIGSLLVDSSSDDADAGDESTSEAIEPVNSQFRYDDWLPSLHLVAQPRDDLLLRLGYSREISRPSIDSLTSPLLLRTSARIVESGNTELRPSRAHAFDVGAEWYGEGQALVAAGLFYTRVDSLIVTESRSVTLDELPYYNPSWQTQDDGSGEYDYRRPINGPGTDISGLELNLQVPFSLLPSFWSGFGFDASYALSKAVARYPLDDGTVSLPPLGLSRHVFNGALWYRGSRFEAGVSLRARSRYLTLVPGNNDNDREGVNASAIVGAWASWQMNNQLTVSLDANNLTNEAFDKFVDQSNRVYSWSVTGTELQLGLNWRFGND